MELAKRFGKNVRRLRRAKDISQEGFADTAGINRSYMSAIETGTSNPTLAVVEKVAKALGVEPMQLLE